VAAPVLGTDAANKAYVDAGLSAANKRIDKADQGVAIALSIQNPVLTGADRFGVSVNWSDFQGNSAVGASAVGIISYN
jgi:trimeric autotransporter adhesin